MERTVKVTAHRGSSASAPENTLSALQLAIDHGADYAEVDVQRTGDGVLVLLHDADLQRVAGDARRLEQSAWNELRQLDVGSWFSAAFRDERVPTLRQAIELVRGRMQLNLELKYGRPDPKLGPAVLKLLREERFLNQGILTSMNRAAIEELRGMEAGVRVGLILTAPIDDPQLLDVDLLSVPLDGVTPELVEIAHRAGKEVHVWNVNQGEDMQRMIAWGVDNIITDRPQVLRALLRA